MLNEFFGVRLKTKFINLKELKFIKYFSSLIFIYKNNKNSIVL